MRFFHEKLCKIFLGAHLKHYISTMAGWIRMLYGAFESPSKGHSGGVSFLSLRSTCLEIRHFLEKFGEICLDFAEKPLHLPIGSIDCGPLIEFIEAYDMGIQAV